MSKEDYVELVSTMCVREVNNLMNEGLYGLAYSAAIKGRRRGAKIPTQLLVDVMSMVE